MSNDTAEPNRDFNKELEESFKSGTAPGIIRLALAYLSGVAPVAGTVMGGEVGGALGSYTGGAISGATAAWSERDQQRINDIMHGWLKLQEDEIKEIGQTIFEIMGRLDLEDENVTKRLESPEYLRLLKKCFRDWSAAESEDKRVLIRNLLINAAGAQITTDDVVTQFVNWIDIYSEAHFKVIRAVYNHAGITRLSIWQATHNNAQPPREDSPDADLFKLLMQDLSTGHIIRQHREKDSYGNFVKPSTKGQRSSRAGSTYTSAFEDGKQYELTGIGEHFVHYTMSEAVQKIDSGAAPAQSTKPPAPVVG
jgi:hypothetical protein